MPDLKIVLITANKNLANAASRAFISAGITCNVAASCSTFLLQDKRDVAIVLIDMESLGPNKLTELRAFIGKIKGISAIALCDPIKTSNREMVDLLSSGVDDVIQNTVDMSLLTAKTRAHLRRFGGGNLLKNDRAAKNWCQDS